MQQLKRQCSKIVEGVIASVVALAGEVSHKSRRHQRLHRELLTRADLDHEAIWVMEKHLLNLHAAFRDDTTRPLNSVLLQHGLHQQNVFTLDNTKKTKIIN